MKLTEVLKLPLEQRLALYGTQNITKFKLDNEEYSGYKAYSFFWEQTLVKQPERSEGGVIDLSTHSWFLTPHLVIDFSMISYSDFIRLSKQRLSKLEFVLEFYDTVFQQNIRRKVYLTPESQPKFQLATRKLNGENWTEIIGVKDFQVEFIGTNADLDTISITYHSNPPSSSGASDISQSSSNLSIGEEVVIGYGITLPSVSGYRLKSWNTKKGGDGETYADNTASTLRGDLVLYAQWESSSSKTLTYNYGLSEPMIDSSTGEYVYSKVVTFNASIGTLPTFNAKPFVEYGGKTYYPYSNGGWYKTPTKGNGSQKLSNNTNYWVNGNSQIYLLYDTNKYTLTYNTNSDYSINPQSVEYGATIALPTLYRNGYTFGGWYTTSTFDDETKFSGTMPPFNLTLYAKWSKV